MGEQPYKKSETFSAQELEEQKDVLKRISQHSATGISSKELVDSFAEYLSDGSTEADADGIDGETKSVSVAIDERDTSRDDNDNQNPQLAPGVRFVLRSYVWIYTSMITGTTIGRSSVLIKRNSPSSSRSLSLR